jgi:hypothetical protein
MDVTALPPEGRLSRRLLIAGTLSLVVAAGVAPHATRDRRNDVAIEVATSTGTSEQAPPASPARTTLAVNSGSYATFVTSASSICLSVCGRGFNVVVIDPATASLVAMRNFDSWYFADAAMEAMLDFLRSVGPNHLVVVATADETGLYRGSASGRRVREFFAAAGSTLINSYTWRDSWVFAYVVGRGRAIVERIGRFYSGIGWEIVSARVTITLPTTSPGDNVTGDDCAAPPAPPTFPNPPGAKIGLAVTLRWNASASATAYRLVADWNGQRVFDQNVGGSTTISGTVAPGRYAVWVIAGNACGESAASAILTFDVP